MSVFDLPRYKANPMNLLFEQFILDVIGHLSADQQLALKDMDLPAKLNVQAKTWQDAVCKALNLSETIEIAILDLWYRNREIGKQKGIDYAPNQFAMDFVDQYYVEGSRVDVWEGDALELARARIATHAKH